MGLTPPTSKDSSTPRRACTAAVALVLCLGWASSATAQQGSELDLVREGLRLNVGLGFVMGDLQFVSQKLIVLADTGQIPSASVGLEAWINENAGFDVSYQIATLGEVEVPLDVLLGEEATLALTNHRFSGSFLYRWFTGPTLTSWSFGLRTGFQLHNITPQPHTPTLILSTTFVGLELGGTARAPFTDWIGLDADASFVLPFQVREFPDDSGRPKNPLGARVGGAPYVRLFRGFYLKARYDLRIFNVGFRGVGNRGLGDVQGGAIDDTYHSAMLQAEWIPEF